MGTNTFNYCNIPVQTSDYVFPIKGNSSLKALKHATEGKSLWCKCFKTSGQYS